MELHATVHGLVAPSGMLTGNLYVLDGAIRGFLRLTAPISLKSRHPLSGPSLQLFRARPPENLTIKKNQRNQTFLTCHRRYFPPVENNSELWITQGPLVPINSKDCPEQNSLPIEFSWKKSRLRRISAISQDSISQNDEYPLEDYDTDNYFSQNTACILQAFSWTSHRQTSGRSWYKHLLDSVDDIAGCGFSDVLLPPCSQAQDEQGFMPQNFYSLNSAYGSSEELATLISQLHEQGLRVCAEVVVNRYGREESGGHVAWRSAGGTVDEEIEWTGWEARSGRGSQNGGAIHEVEELGIPTPIDHSDPMIQSDARGWLSWLRNNVGFDAWCFDCAKAFDPSVVSIYARATSPAFVVGDVWNPMRYNGTALEYNQDQHRQDLVNWVKATRGTAMVLDYTTKGILQLAVEKCEYWRLIDPEGRPPGLLGWWPSKAVTFVDNHTTGSQPQCWPFPAWGVMLGYAYILTHPGLPCVFWDHVYDWQLKGPIKQLLLARKRNKVHSCSSIRILVCHPDLYVARIGDHVGSDSAFTGLVVKIGPSFDMRGSAPGHGWNVCVSGQDFCVWERSQDPKPISSQ